MKICLVCPYSMGFGGVQEHVLNLSRIYKKKGHIVKIICPYNPHFRGFDKIKDDFIFIGRGQNVRINGTNASVTLGIHYEPRIKQILNKENFDIIHFHQPDAPTISWFLLAQSQAVNIVTFHHSGDYGPIEKAIYYLLTPTVIALQRKIYGRIAVSDTARKHAQTYFSGNYNIVPNGIDLKRFNKKGKKISKFTDDKKNILFVGRIEERKGLIYLVRAFAKAKKEDKNLRLIIVGDGPKRKECEDLIKKEKVEDVFFEGAVVSSVLPDYYRSADIFCACSTHGESFGIILLEAMSTGIPIIATSIPGYRELLSDYPEKSLLIPPENVGAIKDAIIRLAKNEKIRDKLSKWGQERVKSYAWETVAIKVLKIYKESSKIRKDAEFIGALWLKKQLLQMESSIKKVMRLLDTEI